MAQMAAHLVEQVIPWVPTRQWVVSVPIPLRYWMASSQHLTAKVHTIIRTTTGQYDVNQAVTQGHEWAHVHPGSVTFIQRFGSALNLHLHFHILFLEGVYLDRTTVGLKPHFLAGAPPTDPDIAVVLQKISHRVIRMLRRTMGLGRLSPRRQAWARQPRVRRGGSCTPPYGTHAQCRKRKVMMLITARVVTTVLQSMDSLCIAQFPSILCVSPTG
jgi:hypothetical protein